MNPSTPDHRRPRGRPPSPAPLLFPRIDPYHSPTPRPSHPQLVFPDLFARASFRTLSAADSLLHLAASPAGSPSRLLSPYKALSLYPSASTGSSSSHGLTHSQSTFPPTPPPTTPSRCLLTHEPHLHANVDVLDLSSHLFSSPTPLFLSPRHCELQRSDSQEISPVLHENEKRQKLAHPDKKPLPALLGTVQDSPRSNQGFSKRPHPSSLEPPHRITRIKLLPLAPQKPAVARPPRTRRRPQFATNKTLPDTNSLIRTDLSPATHSAKSTNPHLWSSPATPLTPGSGTSRAPFPSSQTSLVALSPLSELSEPSPRKRPSTSVCPPLAPFYAPRGDFAPSPPRTRRAGVEKERAGGVVHARKRRRAHVDSESEDDVEPDPERKWKRVRRAVREETPAEVEEERPEEEEEEDEAHIPAPTYPTRTFAPSVPVHPDFPLWYRRFWLPTSDALGARDTQGATPNAPRSPQDLYTPRWVRGRGPTKVGMCPVCVEPPARGGEGKKVWLSMKFSALKCYHMQYYHGISPAGTPFSPPTAFRRVARPGAGKHEKRAVEQGRCHRCCGWVNVEGVKDVGVKVREIFWWKHAATCHQGATAEGERDVFVDA